MSNPRDVQRCAQPDAPFDAHGEAARASASDANSGAASVPIGGPLNAVPASAANAIETANGHCRCGLPFEAGAVMCPHGHPRPGHPGPALRHGRYAQRDHLPARVQDAIADLATFEANVISDLGGASELSSIEVGHVRRLCELEAACRILALDIASRGLLTTTGRIRPTLAEFRSTVREWRGVASALGLKRRARDVYESPLDWLRRSPTPTDSPTPTETEADRQAGRDDDDGQQERDT
jgi:hypothetical protein